MVNRMPEMKTLLAQHCPAGERVTAWLATLVNEWHLLADLSFSDLILWVPTEDPNQMWAVAQIRPTTGPTATPVRATPPKNNGW